MANSFRENRDSETSLCQQRTLPFSAAHLAPDAAILSLIYTVGSCSSAWLGRAAVAGEGHGKVYFYMQILLIQYERVSSFTGCNSSPQQNTVSSSSIIGPFGGLKTDFQSLSCITVFTGVLTAVRWSHPAGLRLFCPSQSTRLLPRESKVMSNLTWLGSPLISNRKKQRCALHCLNHKWFRNSSKWS